jgi:nicotinate-nucleotide adenylyltransferase
MKVGILGGTFDPIHLGHLIAGECALEGAAMDEVWFMPANVPPHKERPAGGADSGQRWDMVNLAIRDHPRFRATDREIVRGGTSYSIDTVRELQEEYPGVGFSYIIGADMVQYLPKWHRIGELVGMISFIGLQRPGTIIDWGELTEEMKSGVLMIPMPQIDISSTEIRERRRGGRSVRYLVPEAVREYMEGAKLYE